jgi:hypothetical protein
MLPQYNNTVLELGSERTINQSTLEIRIPKLVHGTGSSVLLRTDFNYSGPLMALGIFAVYDQGSDSLQFNDGIDDFEAPKTTRAAPLNFTKVGEEFTQQAQFSTSTLFTPGLVTFYTIFFAGFGIIIYLYIRRRKAMKRFLSKVVKNAVEIRGALRDDPSNKDSFSEVWFEMSKKNVKTTTI